MSTLARFNVPDPRGVNAAAVADFGDIPMALVICELAGVALLGRGVNDGDATFSDFFPL